MTFHYDSREDEVCHNTHVMDYDTTYGRARTCATPEITMLIRLMLFAPNTRIFDDIVEHIFETANGWPVDGL